MEIEEPGAKAQAEDRGLVDVERGPLDRLGTCSVCGPESEMSPDLDPGRTEPRDPS